jgi:hypothetical protein
MTIEARDLQASLRLAARLMKRRVQLVCDTDDIVAGLRNWHYDQLGVTWTADAERGRNGYACYYFANFRRLPCGKKGNGAIALRQLCELMDALNLPITLQSTPGLFDWYPQFGFVRADTEFGFYRLPPRLAMAEAA